MSRNRLRPAASAGVLWALAATAALVLPSCGESPLRRATDAFRAEVEPLLVREEKVWRQIGETSAELDHDPRGPRYFAYLEGTAVPWYEEMRAALAAVVPGHERLAPVREDLLRSADLRREFVKQEIGRRDLLADPGVTGAEEARIRAGIAETEYYESLGGELPDPRFSELSALRDEVVLRMLPDLRDGKRDVPDAAERIRRHVLPKLRELRDSRYDDDARSKALRRAVALAEEGMRTLADALPANVALARATVRSSSLAKESEEARRRAVEARGAAAREK